MTENYFIALLLPIVAIMLVCQTNPYHALILRGVLGAIAALLYAVLGAGDVGLTEALMGSLLAVMLYAVTVRSSLVMRLGILKEENLEPMIENLRSVMNKHYMRVELVPFSDRQDLEQALSTKEIHATCVREAEVYDTAIRIPRLYEILQNELAFPQAQLTYKGEKL
jgi:putative multicomponent Na+:H+ antiporter subunit B